MAPAYLKTAELVANERRQGFSNVTAGLGVLAGIAALTPFAVCVSVATTVGTTTGVPLSS